MNCKKICEQAFKDAIAKAHAQKKKAAKNTNQASAPANTANSTSSNNTAKMNELKQNIDQELNKSKLQEESTDMS